MKKTICIILIISLGAIFLNSNLVKGSISKPAFQAVAGDEDIQKSISKKIIRFHVIANSDTTQDQALKLKVRDQVLSFITPKLKDSKSIDESRNIIKKYDADVKKLAEQTVKNNGYTYNVVTMLSEENFPVKYYGNIVLPQGKYEAYRIIIGSGKGQNWWCVMFPPLCFIDITKGEVAKKQTETEMKTVLNKTEFQAVDNNPSKTSEEKVQYKFKIVELIQDLINGKGK
jgi:stage II sporulation protein R